MMRVALFVDGSNLFGSLKTMGLDVNDYEQFYKFVFERVVHDWRGATGAPESIPTILSRVYWYLVGSMDDWDLADPKAQAHLRDRFDNDRDLKRTYMALAGPSHPGASQEAIATEAWAMCFREFKEWYERKGQILDGMLRFQHGVRESTDLIDIVSCGHWKVDFLHKALDEKGLDATLAVDMAVLADNYDVAALLSGDADTIPSICYLKTRGKHIAAVEFIAGYPPEKRGRGFSSRLKLHADLVTRIYEMELVTKKVASKRRVERATESHHGDD